MAFYSKLLYETKKFDNFLKLVGKDNSEAFSIYGIANLKFIFHATDVLKNNKKNITKVLEGCIDKELWGFFTFLLTVYASYDGVEKVVMKNYQKLPRDLQAGIVSVLCYCQKWTHPKMNDLFLELAINQDRKDDALDEIESDVIDVYYPLRWGESIETAIHNPCWFYSEVDAEAYCINSKMYSSKKANNIPELTEFLNDFFMYGEGENKSSLYIADRIIKAKISKKDVIAFIDTDNLFDFVPQKNIIQNSSVYDITALSRSDVEEGEVDYLSTLLTAYNKDDDLNDDEYEDRLWDIYDLIIENCEKAGMPETVSSIQVMNKEMVSPNEVALLIRTRLRADKSNALKVAKEICRLEKNAKWIYSSSQGYKPKRGYFYRGLCYSSYSNKIFAVAFQYLKNDGIRVFTKEPSFSDHKEFSDVFAVDFHTEAKTLDGCLEKCRKIADPEKKKETKTEIKTVKETLSAEEKEAIKNQYREEVDTEYQKEIQMHKDSADSKANELEILKIKYEKLLRENEELKRKLAKKQDILDTQDDVSVLSIGSEKEKYDGETHAMVLSAIRHELKNCDRDTRRHDVLESVLKKNINDNDPISDKLAEIKRITKGYRIASEMKPGLIKQGFQYTEDGRHPKIQYPNDDRYIITAASTTSDTRAGENLYALIKKKFF